MANIGHQDTDLLPRECFQELQFKLEKGGLCLIDQDQAAWCKRCELPYQLTANGS